MAKNSIKSFLVLNLLLSVTLVSSIAIVGNLFLEHQGFQKNLDSQLSLTAHTIDAFSEPEADFKKIQMHLHRISKFHKNDIINESVQYLITNSEMATLIKSSEIPNFEFKNLSPGYHDLWLDHKPWRLFLLENKNKGLNIYTIQRHDFRAKLERDITEESFIIMLLTYPFLGLLIWAVVSKGFSGLDSATKSLRKRKRNNLRPLLLTKTPTEIEPLIKAINSLLERLDQSFQREQRFAGDAAHELKTPLAALSANIQLAQTEKDQKKLKEILKTLSVCVDRSTHVVEQLLTLSRMTPGTEINTPTQLNLGELAQNMIIELLSAADNKNIELALVNKTDAKIIGNSSAISILMRNLIDNAIRYSPENSLVSIEITSDNNQVILAVSDQGPGIPDELKARVFERFFRILGNNTKGSGLGLGIVKEIADFHHAKIKLLDANPGLIVEIRFEKHK